MVGDAAGSAGALDACAFATMRKKELAVRLDGEEREVLLTRAPYGKYAIAPTGETVRYVLAPEVRERKSGYLEGVSCCCGSPERLTGREEIAVLVGRDPAVREERIPYGVVEVTLCDPKAPQ